MKDKLQLEEVLPYLPYKLKVFDTIANKLKVLNIAQGSSTNWVGVKTLMNYSNNENNIYKLVLKPLSYFQKKTGRELMDVFSIELSTVHEIWNLIDKDITLDEVSVKTYNAMCKNHIDFKNLIGRGLAVDIKTIK